MVKKQVRKSGRKYKKKLDQVDFNMWSAAAHDAITGLHDYPRIYTIKEISDLNVCDATNYYATLRRTKRKLNKITAVNGSMIKLFGDAKKRVDSITWALHRTEEKLNSLGVKVDKRPPLEKRKRR